MEANLVAVVVVLKSQKEECHPGEDIFNASFHNDIKITTITWDSPNTANIVPFGGDWGGGGGGAELKESPWREYCQCLFHKNNNLTVQTMFHLESWHSGEYNVNAALLNLFKNYLGFLKNCVVFTKIYVRARER